MSNIECSTLQKEKIIYVVILDNGSWDDLNYTEVLWMEMWKKLRITVLVI